MSTTVDAAPSGRGATPPTSDEPALPPGALIGRFQVRRTVGRGGAGQVYLARDVELGRSVALKLVRPDRMHDADPDEFVREARITAQLNHPHIVQIHDIGRHGDVAYLALEYLDGESLRDRMLRGPLSADESLRILRAIADALCHAHASGVYHCDLKPANVMLPSDGRVRVVDFGLAAVRTPTGPAETFGGTVDWMAPEQWNSAPVSDRTDVWALAVVAHELLTGAHPFGASATPEVRRMQILEGALHLRTADAAAVSDRIRAHLVTSLSADPQVRPTARDWFEALDDALTGADSAALAEAPFRGLAAFEELHAGVFFGREADVDAFMERLREQPAVAIVGPSGVGKSSFLLAGVIPRLRARGGWTIIRLRPGVAPFAAIAHKLLAAIDDKPDAAAVAELAHALRETPTLLAVRLATIAASYAGQVLLAIDQLEEVFTQGCPPREIEAFLAMLSVLDDASEPVRITCTVRDDYFTRWLQAGAPFILRRLGGADLRRTITAPLDRLGYRFDNPAIVDDMLAETGNALIDLPLVQFACRALWDSRDAQQRVLRTSDYKDLGGVTGALAHHAQQVTDAMTAEEQRITRDLLGRLVVGNNARRIVERGALLDGLPAAAGPVLDRLVTARLLAQHRPAATDAFTVELAHESLLVNWTQLRRWLEESSEERRFLDELEADVAPWERRGRRDDDLPPEADLAAVRARARGLGLVLPERLERFVAAGEAHHQRRRRRARWRRAAVVGAALAIAATALVVATRFRRQKLEAQAQAAALELAGGNTGTLELVLRPFEWRGDEQVPVSAGELPGLTISLYQTAPDDLDLPGPPIPEDLVRISRTAPGTMRIEAPGGPAYLRIDGRGRAGETCAASWLRIMAMPGYAQRGHTEKLDIPIPTCAASVDDVRPIPAGEFWYGGLGVPAARFPDAVEPERQVPLPEYAIDRTEVSNLRYRPFAGLSHVTRYPGHDYPSVLDGAGEPHSPVTSIDAFTAEAYCRYLGKRLPTDEEWVKAARGGLIVDGQPNPEPRRLYPWGTDQRSCFNGRGVVDGYRWVAPVGAFECGASPYGAINMAGNVQEWIAQRELTESERRSFLDWLSQTGQTSDSSLRVVRGGLPNSPRDLDHASTAFRNVRAARYFDFSIGVRCVADQDPVEGSIWRSH